MNAATDFWGIVVPGWIGALSGFIGGAVAVVSLIIAIRSKQTADDAKASGATIRSVVADTITELQRGDDEELQRFLADQSARAQGIAPLAPQEQDMRADHDRRSARYDALLRRLEGDEAASPAAAAPQNG